MYENVEKGSTVPIRGTFQMLDVTSLSKSHLMLNTGGF